jgi:ribosomal protein L37AE/L43A
MIVPAQYVTCTEHPLSVEEIEGRHANRSAMCLACENNPANAGGAEIVPFSISLTGDFTDTDDSEPFRFYEPTKVTGIYPKYGPKDGDTFVQVWGENFLNMDQDLRCNFGSKSTVGHFVNSGYITCRAPRSDVVGSGIPFSVSLNKQ